MSKKIKLPKDKVSVIIDSYIHCSFHSRTCIDQSADDGSSEEESDGSPDADMKGEENRHLGPVTPIKKAASGISKGIPSLGSSFLFISPLMF